MFGGLGGSDGKFSPLWKQLEKERTLSKEEFKDVLKQARREDRHVAEVLFSATSLPPERLLEILAEYFQTPSVILRQKVISPYILNLIPKDVAQEHSVIVFKKVKDEVHVATTQPDNLQTIEFIRKKTGLEPKVFLTTPEDIEHGLKRYSFEISTEFAKIIEDSMRETVGARDSAEQLAQHVPIIQMVNSIIDKALNRGASDIHIEPTSNNVVVRYRIDGLLSKVVDLPIELLPPLSTRIKLLSNLKIDEHRAAQDGRFSYAYSNREVAVRVSALPTLHGMKMVLRLLDARQKQFTLRSLGLNNHDYAIVKQQLAKPHGMILVTGPTGSGKTTTLYTILGLLNKETVNICTIEDPIEYGLTGISQTQINPSSGLTFAQGLRSLLRQDPNIIMVGEIRDAETADISVNAAMTGHLVLSTLHTNTAFQAIQRLVEMGVQPFLTASVLNMIIGQRLVRKVCRFCAVQTKLSSKIFEQYAQFIDVAAALARLQEVKLVPAVTTLGQLTFSRGAGCAKCGETGYQGRVGIYELLNVDEAMHQHIISDQSPEAIAKASAARGSLTMREDGVLKALSGLTTLDEVIRVTT